MKELTEKKTFSCSNSGCGKPFDAHQPDDIHTIASVEKKKGSIERIYKCPRKHKNKIYWSKEAGPRIATV